VLSALPRQDQILGLDVAMNHALLEGVLQTLRRLLNIEAGMRHRQRSVRFHHGGEVLALDVLHGEDQQIAQLQSAVGGNHVDVVELGRRADLPQETFDRAGPIQQRFGDDLEDFEAVHQLVLGQVDDAHAAAAEFAEDLVLRVVGQLRRQVKEGGRTRWRFGPAVDPGERLGGSGSGASTVGLAETVEEIVAGQRGHDLATVGAEVQMGHQRPARILVQFAQAERFQNLVGRMRGASRFHCQGLLRWNRRPRIAPRPL
jgi:hypothetical protein